MIVIHSKFDLYCKSCYEKNDTKDRGLLYPVFDNTSEKERKVVGLECPNCRDFIMFADKHGKRL